MRVGSCEIRFARSILRDGVCKMDFASSALQDQFFNTNFQLDRNLLGMLCNGFSRDTLLASSNQCFESLCETNTQKLDISMVDYLAFFFKHDQNTKTVDRKLQ